MSKIQGKQIEADHGALAGLADDDHLQYALADGTRGAFATVAQGNLADTAMQPSDDAATLGSGASLDGQVLTSDGLGNAAWETPASGVTDHGLLSGLADDDHTQYALADGTRGSFATVAQGNLADTAMQPLDNISTLTNDAGYQTAADVDGDVSAHAALTSGVHGISTFGATLVDDADAATARTTLGLPTATQVEMEAGTEAALRAMSPLLVAQAIAALSSGGSGISIARRWMLT